MAVSFMFVTSVAFVGAAEAEPRERIPARSAVSASIDAFFILNLLCFGFGGGAFAALTVYTINVPMRYVQCLKRSFVNA